MTQRVFGPIRGAGTQVTELSGDKPIEPGALGLVGYAGVLERGPVGTLIGPITSKAALEQQVGGVISDSLLPDACQANRDVAAGAGGLLLVRVTDGNEQKAQGPKTYARTANLANLYARRTVRTPIGSLRAKNGGRWAGKTSSYTDAFSVGGDLTEITLDTGLTKFTTDEWAGGYIELDAVPNKRYPITGNDAAGIVTVAADSTMASDLASSLAPTNFRYYLVLDNVNDVGAEKVLTFEIRDGEEKPTTEFGLFVYVDGALVWKKPDLSMNPNDKRWWVDMVNKDGGNFYVEAVDTFTGTRTADVRPANAWGEIDTAGIAETTLQAIVHSFTILSPVAGGNPTLALGTTLNTHLAQTIAVTMTAPTTGTVVSDRFGALGTLTLGTLFDPPNAAGGALANKWCPPFTITAGATPLAATDVLTIRFFPFIADELIGGYLYPDAVNFPKARFRIVGNTHKVITVADGSDMTTVAAVGDEFRVEAPLSLYDGRDGVADLADADYIQQAWDVDFSPFNRVVGKGYGLIKFATPGITSTAVQKAGVAYAEAKNHQYRYEVPSNIVLESDADTYVNDTLGRSDYAVVSFPSYVYVADPFGGGEGRLKLVSATGMAHGREARIANDFLGYHKAGAGQEATLPAVLDLPTADAVLNEELLNPRGINVIKKVKGNFVLWGDRTLWLDPLWKWKHQRELMSYYEHVLQESFDWIIFQLNNSDGRDQVKSSLVSFFLPEYTKNALDTDFSFPNAASIKIDTENNTPATKAAGDMIVEILLRLVDTVERLRIFIGKQGIFEAAA